MKSLEERKKQRAAQRAENLKDSPVKDTGISQDGVSNDGKAYADMTIAELQAAATGLGTDVPKEKTKRDDILEFVENLAKFKAAESGEGGNGSGAETKASSWKSGN